MLENHQLKFLLKSREAKGIFPGETSQRNLPPPDRSFCPEDFAKKGELTPSQKSKNFAPLLTRIFALGLRGCLKSRSGSKIMRVVEP